MTRIALVPGCLALLPAYASLLDPVPELRAACAEAVAWLGEDVRIVAADQGRRVAEALLATRTGVAGDGGSSYLVVANGAATRSERAPGYLDERAFDFDRALAKSLIAPDPAALRAVDTDLSHALWADVATLAPLADLLDAAHLESVDYDDDPYGVQYWVLRWAS